MSCSASAFADTASLCGFGAYGGEPQEGNALYKQRKFDEALTKYEAAIEADPKEMAFHLNKAGGPPFSCSSFFLFFLPGLFLFCWFACPAVTIARPGRSTELLIFFFPACHRMCLLLHWSFRRPFPSILLFSSVSMCIRLPVGCKRSQPCIWR